MLHALKFERFGLRLWQGKREGVARCHCHTEIELLLLMEGSLALVFGGTSLPLPSRQLIAFNGITPHELRFQDNPAELYQMTIPLSAVLDWRLPEIIAGQLMRGGVLADNDSDNDPRRFDRWVEDLRSGDVRKERVTLPEIHARFERMALSKTLHVLRSAVARKTGPGLEGAETKVELMVHNIALNSHQTMSIKQISEGTGWHPRYAVTQFKRWVGTTPWEFLLEQRVARARHLLATSNLKIVDVSEECGFTSPSSFYVAFGRIVGCAPKEFRRRYEVGS